ncbi:MAG: ABC transporter permease [Candidatus Korobacteraceae bacterium]|jgi:putative ABC transport system permease protein
MPRPAKVRSISWAVSPKSTLVLREILAIAVNSFRADKVRATMTALGMVIGTFSLVLVVTIALTGKQYVLHEIQNIGANLIWAEYAGAANAGASTGTADYLTVDDMIAVEQQVPGVQAATPVLNLHEPILVGNGRQRDMLILGVNPEYANVRRIIVSAGRFFDQQDSQSHHKVALITEDFANRQYGGAQFASGHEINIQGLPFIVIGTFRESVETFGQSEIQDDTVLIPYSMARYLTDTNAVNQIYFSMSDGSSIPRATEKILAVLKARHRAESVYNVGNLTQVLSLVAKTANAFTIVLLLFATITLIAGGVGIMNIMLATVSARIREIGIRKAVGATRREIQLQFLSEAVMISLIGGTIGTLAGLALPFSLWAFTQYMLPVSGLSALIAMLVSCLIGITFGTLPAKNASRLDPVESLKHE